jgi:DNA-binding GntR family transcriptional regulator
MQLQRADLVEQVYQRIKDAILQGALEPLAPLRQEELAEMLGVSRQPVSHALMLLEHDGLLVDHGKKGKMVAPIDANQLLALYQVRSAIDSLAARLAAERVDEDGADQLRAVIKLGREAETARDAIALAQADMQFHRLLYTLSGNPEIARVADTSWTHMVRSMHRVLEDPSLYTHIWDQHSQIAEAIIQHEPDRAAQLSAHHAEASGHATHQRLTQEAH